MIVFSLIMWYVIGVVGFLFWWTIENDFTTDDVPVAAAAGLIGPFAWFVGFNIHGKQSTIFKKRK